MEFYVIPPNKHLDLMHKGDRYFCLAQQYIANEQYRQFFKARVEEGSWVTLDNGAGDHDTVSIEQLLDVARDLQPSELIPLDILFDGAQTLKNLDITIELMKADPILSKIEIFACPQGKDQRQWLNVYTKMVNDPNVNTIGMSKLAIPHVVSGAKNDTNIAKDRNYMYTLLKQSRMIKKPLHFLGAGEPWEFEMYKDDPLCRSTDSCFSIWSAMVDQDFSSEDFKRVATPKDYFEREIEQDSFELIEKNIQFIRNIIE